MSLDVYLRSPSSPEGEERERIYIRQGGATREVSRAEWDELHPGRDPVVVVLPDDGSMYSRNITHNLARMAGHAGKLYEAMWRPDEEGWTHARDLIEPLTDGLARLQADPEHFKQFNPENGWGDYDGLCEFVADYLGACMKWPDAEVEVSR